jgi:hypothetical protein
VVRGFGPNAPEIRSEGILVPSFDRGEEGNNLAECFRDKLAAFCVEGEGFVYRFGDLVDRTDNGKNDTFKMRLNRNG